MITFQPGYNVNTINHSKVTVSKGGGAESRTTLENDGNYALVSGLLVDYRNNAYSVIGRTSTGVLYNDVTFGSGAFGDVTIVNRASSTGTLFAHIYIDDADSFNASLGIANTPSGGIRLGGGESYKPDRPVSFIGVLGSGFNIDVYGRFDRYPNLL